MREVKDNETKPKISNSQYQTSCYVVLNITVRFT